MGWMRWVAIGCFVAVALGLAGLAWTMINDEPGAEVQACRDYLRDNANRPGSVSWPGGETVVSVEGDSIRTVYGRVRATDLYGNRSVTMFECQVQPLIGGGWRVIDVE